MSYLIVLPSIHPPSTERCLAGMAPALKDRLLLVDNSTLNRGLAASWNLGARVVLDQRLDWLVILSAGTRFGPAGGEDFVALLDRYDGVSTWVIESEAPVNQHLMAWSRPMLEGIGLVDCNFFPIYLDEADACRRVHVAQAEGWGGEWEKEPVDAWVTMVGHATKLAGVRYDWDRSLNYYLSKWGGRSGDERFARPFNDPNLPLWFWPVPPDPRAVEHEGWGR